MQVYSSTVKIQYFVSICICLQIVGVRNPKTQYIQNICKSKVIVNCSSSKRYFKLRVRIVLMCKQLCYSSGVKKADNGTR